METLTATLATLAAIWFLTCVAFYVHANTQDKILASWQAFGKRQATERDTLATATQELLEAFNTVTAERDALRLAFNAKHLELEELLEDNFTLTAEDFAQ